MDDLTREERGIVAEAFTMWAAYGFARLPNAKVAALEPIAEKLGLWILGNDKRVIVLPAPASEHTPR